MRRKLAQGPVWHPKRKQQKLRDGTRRSCLQAAAAKHIVRASPTQDPLLSAGSTGGHVARHAKKRS